MAGAGRPRAEATEEVDSAVNDMVAVLLDVAEEVVGPPA